MPRISNSKRLEILRLINDGLNQSQVARECSVSRCAVQNIIKKQNLGLPIQDRPRSGRPQVLNERDRRKVVIESKKDLFATAKHIQRRSNLNGRCSTELIRVVLKKYGLFGCIAAKKPFLTKRNKAKRLEYCQERLNWNSIDWSKYIFSDEVKVFAGLCTRQYFRRKRGTRFLNQNTVKTKKFPLSVMLWGAIRADGKRVLLMCNDNVDSMEYQRLVEAALPEIYTRRYVFQHDGARCHTSRSTYDYFERKMVRVLKGWPPQSPDLNIIEGLWDIVKENIQKTQVLTKAELYQTSLQAFNAIPNETIAKLYESLPRRMAAVVRARGSNTKY